MQRHNGSRPGRDIAAAGTVLHSINQAAAAADCFLLRGIETGTRATDSGSPVFFALKKAAGAYKEKAAGTRCAQDAQEIL
jgi:hypothetical protein